MLEPLAARLRPVEMQQFIGQDHLLAPGKPLRTVLEQGILHSMVLWGPPGCGKTSLARLIAAKAHAEVDTLSAVFTGVKDIRLAIDKAKSRQADGMATVLFVDEVHRFNKSQQDAFLPFIEDGTITFVGATTENPSFELNNALLSRVRVYVLKALDSQALADIICQALVHEGETMAPDLIQQLAMACDGDARRALNYTQLSIELANTEGTSISQGIITEIITGKIRRFDKHGEAFYDQMSALHKSVRGSNPDASLYWLMRLLDGGCSAEYIMRRMVRMASEDIGNADPRALELSLNAWDAYERLGQAEGELALAQAVTYLAIAAKSNACYLAYKRAKAFVESNSSHEVPLHLRNAPTQLMKKLGFGKRYRYAHDEPYAYAAGEHYFPEALSSQAFYCPTDRGLEAKIQQKLQFLQQLDDSYQTSTS